MEPVIVIGAGLAGSEAAWQLARRGIPVQLREMKPEKMSPAHHSPDFAELVCSNSLRSDQLENAVGLLKEELRRCGSLIMACADEHRVEAGGALAVDRYAFSAAVTEKLRAHPNVTVLEGEVTEIPPEGNVIFATGPLTSQALSEQIAGLFPDSRYLNFFDAAAPLVTFDSVDMDSAWFASRYDRGTPDYVNCPLAEEEYRTFWRELTQAQEAEVHGFEDAGVFEGCMPVEVMARRLEGKPPIDFPRETAMGSMALYISDPSVVNFQPMNVNFGLIPPLDHRVKGKRNKNAEISRRALERLGELDLS